MASYGGKYGARASLAKAYIRLLQAFLVPFLYRSNYVLAHTRQRIPWSSRKTFHLVKDVDFLLDREWLKKATADRLDGDTRIFHLSNISAYPADRTVFYCGKITNWRTGITPFKLGAIPSATLLFEDESFRTPLQYLRVKVPPPYDPEFVEDIRIFDCFGSLWGTGSVRDLAQDKTRPLVVRFELRENKLEVVGLVVLDESVLGNALPLHRHEKNWTPVECSPTEIHFIQNHAEGHIVSLNTQTMRAAVLPARTDCKVDIPEVRKPDFESELRLPSCPIRISRGDRELLLTLGHRKLEGYFNHRIWTRATFYRTYAVLMEPAPPYAIVRVSDPVYFDILPKSYVFPFQLIEIPCWKNELLVSLYIGGRYNELLTIEKNALMKALFPETDQSRENGP